MKLLPKTLAVLLAASNIAAAKSAAPPGSSWVRTIRV